MPGRIMIQGTMSNVGKSILVAGLCRIFKQDGYRVAPFKSQNMALNSFITTEGLEIGRAQAMQCEAAGIAPSVAMNPILLKPTGHMGSQVIVMGEVAGNMSAAEYFHSKQTLRPIIKNAYDMLLKQYDIVVIEGAGSPAEINLKNNDIVNMGMAEIADAPVLLAGDIDRGGVFAQLYGTMVLLTAIEKKRVKGLIVNKFRGDLEILRPGIRQLEKLCSREVLGVVPYLNIDLEDEDSLAERVDKRTNLGKIDIAVIRLPHISNFTDFQPLETISGVSVRYVKAVHSLGQPDLIILPGTKNTMHDLMWLRENGLEAAVKAYAAYHKPVIGICGGYQMMGEKLIDAYMVEGGGELAGMCLLPVTTEFVPQKSRTQVTGKFMQVKGIFSALTDISFKGYEIHMGKTSGNCIALSQICAFEMQSNLDGAQLDNCYGTYVHGIFDQREVAMTLVSALMQSKGITDSVVSMDMDFDVYKQKQYDLLADGLRNSLDMKKVYDITFGARFQT